MSIKPVDFQVMLPKSAEVAKLQSDEHSKNLALQQSQANAAHTKSDAEIRQVHSQERAQEAKIREKREKDQGKRNQGKKYKKLYGKKEEEQEESSTIDIRL